MKNKKKIMLTLKQELYCREYLRLGNKSAAYRAAYSAKKMKAETINNKAYVLFQKDEVRARIDELRGRIEKKEIYTLEESIKKDLRLINRYEVALDTLENKTSSDENIKVAKRIIVQIGSAGYSSAQDRISKKYGWYERNNLQKSTRGEVVVFIPDNGR